jgi:hypothetical protein
LDEGGQHSFYLGYFIHKRIAFLFAEEIKITGKQNEILQFARAPHGNLKKSI